MKGMRFTILRTSPAKMAAPVASALELPHDLSQLAVGTGGVNEGRLPHITRQHSLRIASFHGFSPRDIGPSRRCRLLHFDRLGSYDIDINIGE